MKIFSIALFGLLGLESDAQTITLIADTTIDLIQENLVTGERIHHYIIRIYAVLPSQDDRLTLVYGNSEHPLRIHADNLLQMADGEALAGNNRASTVEDSTYIDYDSWVTIQKTSKKDLGQVYFLESPEQPWTSVFESGKDLVMDDGFGGAWFTLPGDSSSAPDSSRKVLLGQFRVQGKLDLLLNLQILEGKERSQREVTGLELHLPLEKSK